MNKPNNNMVTTFELKITVKALTILTDNKWQPTNNNELTKPVSL